MLWLRWVVGLSLSAWAAFAATFGTVVPLVGGASDLVLDEGRNRLYLISSTRGQVEVYSIPQRRFLTPVRTDPQPISGALSRSGKYLYVTSYDGSALDVLDLDELALVKRVSLPARPEGVAVGADERVLITTIGTGPGNAASVLLVYDPQASEGSSLSNVVVTPPPPTPPQLPAPAGRPFLAYRSQLIATPDGRYIIGLNKPNANTMVVFVYEVASSTVLRSRNVGGLSTVLSVAPDGSKFMAGLTLFDTATLAVVAQQNAANSPFPYPPNTNFNLQQNQGGSVFAPDGSALYSAFNIVPVQNPPARANVSQLLVGDPDNLLIRLGLQMPENLAGKMVISSDGGTIYALSESGFLVLPVAAIYQSPIAMPEWPVSLLVNDQCGVLEANRSTSFMVRNQGAGRLTASVQLLQTPQTGPGGLGGAGGPGGGAPGGAIIIVIPPGAGGVGGGVITPPPVGQPPAVAPGQQAAIVQNAPQARVEQSPAGPSLQFSFNANAARSPGTITPHDFLVQSNEAINIPPSVRVFQNNRDSEARAEVVPIPVGISPNEGLVDLAVDSVRQRLYIANSGLNRVEVFDMRGRQLLRPIKVGQLPRSLAVTPDGNTLYVANTGGESISIVDLNKGEVVGRVKFPPIPFNGSVAVITPSLIAPGLNGAQVVMSNGTLWKIVGEEAVPRPVSPAIGVATVPAPRTMAATPNGEYVLLLAGNGFAYLYDAMVDDYVVGRQVISAPIQGYYGPVAAGPRGQYFVVNGTVLNQALTPVATSGSAGQAPGRPDQPIIQIPRPVAAVAPASANAYARFAQPVRQNANQLPTEAPVIEIADVNTGNTMRTAAALEGPLASAVGTQRVNVNGRTLALGPSGDVVYALTTSGLSIVPLDAPRLTDRPQINPNGAVSMASYLPNVAPGGLISIFGRELGAEAMFDKTPLPTMMGGVCVTASNRALPLIVTSPLQINAQIPPDLPAGRHALVVRSIERKIASPPLQLSVARYAPAVFVDPETMQPAIFHEDGTPVNKEHPARRDERLMLFATGLGATRGGRVTAGMPAPSDTLAVTDRVQVFFGDPRYREAEMIVEWSGLAPGYIGLYQVNLMVPGDRIHGDDLPVTLRIGGVDSSQAGPVPPRVSVR